MYAQLCEDYRFNGQTAWAAVNLFDRYLSKAVDTPRKQIELISLSCLLLAAKFFECRSPCLEDLCSVSQKRLSKDDFKSAEQRILFKLDWDLCIPSPHSFLLHVTHIMSVRHDGVLSVNSQLIQRRAEFLVDLSAFEYAFLALPLSAVAGASFVCALRLLRLDCHIECWNEIENELCSLLDCEQDVLAGAEHQLMKCYHSCVDTVSVESKSAPLMKETSFRPVNAKDERMESPDTVLTPPIEGINSENTKSIHVSHKQSVTCAKPSAFRGATSAGLKRKLESH